MNLLLVEDNEAHAELIKLALENASEKNVVTHLSDGEKALDFMYRRGEFKDAPTPSLVFLDLRMPKVDGIEVLRTLKDDKELRKIPILILSTSESPKDIEAAYDAFANCYLVKPSGFSDLSNLINDVLRFWDASAKTL